MTKEQYINSRYDDYLHYWANIALKFGPIAVVALMPLDYLVTPSNFREFAAYRLCTAAVLFLLYLFNRRALPRTFVNSTVVLAAVAVSTMLALMIARFGGHQSPYATGFILLGIFVSGITPMRFGACLVSSLIVYAFYGIPLLVYDSITNMPHFLSESALIFACLSTMLLLRYVANKRLFHEFALQFAVEQYKTNLEEEVKERTRQLSFTIMHLEQEVQERELAEKALIESQDIFRHMADDSPLAISMMTKRGAIEYVNTAHTEIVGYTREMIPTLEDWWAVAYPETGVRKELRAEWQNTVTRLFNGERIGNVQRKIVCKDGTIKDVELRIVRAADKIIVAFDDITERRRIDDLIRRAKDDWEDTFNTINDAITIHDKDFNIVRVNSAAERLLGKNAEEILRNKCFISYHGTGCPPDCCPTCLTLQNGMASVTELFEPHLSKYIEIKALPRFDQAGTLIGLIHVVRDITERKRAEEALFASVRKYRELVENANSIILRWGRDGLITFLNEFGQKFFGYAEDEILGRHVVGTIVPDVESTGRDLRPMIDDICADPKKFESNINENMRHNGERVWISWTNKVIYDDQDKVSEILSIGSDITDRIKAEDALLEERGFSTNLIRNSASATFVLDKAHRVMIWNKACEELTGYREDEMIGTDNQWKAFYDAQRPTIADVIIDNSFDLLPELYNKHSKSVLSPQAIRAEGWYKNLGGTDRYISFEAAPIRNSKGELIAAIETLQDVTESKRLEEQLLQAQKIEAVGQLAGGVAHDFNNILTAIVGYAHLTLIKMPQDEPLRKNVEQILQASDKATALTQSLLAFSRKQIINPKPVNLIDIVKRLEKLLIRLIREDIQIVTTYAPDVLTVFADAGQIEQVLMNLVTNARDAMPHGGRIMITTEAITIDSQFIDSHGYGKAGRYALLSVSDNGEGMDAKTREKIFEPFFTTKEQGKGTGLGLAMVYGIIKQHDGFIDVDSEPEKGTAFKIYLPLSAGFVETTKTGEDSVTIKGGTETVLLAEDDSSLRKLMTTVLQNQGYTVIDAVDGEDAVQKYSSNSDIIQLLILDGIMPKKNGKEALNEIRLINPSVKALFVSGYAEDIVSKQGLLESGINFIQKPLSPSVLLKRVRELLDAEV